MSESAPPPVPDRAAASSSGLLTAEAIENVLVNFRYWLEDLASRGRQPPEGVRLQGLTPLARQESPDLHTLLGQMIAIRQEVNLQTKTVRAQQEQNTATLRILEDTLEDLRDRSAPAPNPVQQQQSPDDLLRPLLKTLIDVHDALSLALREADRVQDSLEPLLENLAGASIPDPPEVQDASVPPLEQPSRSWLARLLGVQGVTPKSLADWQDTVRTACEKRCAEALAETLQGLRDRAEQDRQGRERIRQMLGSLTAGYRMGLQRIERALTQHGVEAIPAVGETFDPERMEVLEAADNTGRPAGSVLDEVRRGYLWRGRVFRYAQVRVARS